MAKHKKLKKPKFFNSIDANIEWLVANQSTPEQAEDAKYKRDQKRQSTEDARPAKQAVIFEMSTARIGATVQRTAQLQGLVPDDYIAEVNRTGKVLVQTQRERAELELQKQKLQVQQLQQSQQRQQPAPKGP